MNRIDRTFKDLRARGVTALVPFLTAGDPSMDATLELMRAVASNGADLLEIGVPFSDPTADGPTLQRSLEIGLTQGASLGRILDLVATFRRESDLPIVLYGYFNPIFHYGCETFARDARMAGVDGLLVVDLPPEESRQLVQWTRRENLHVVSLLAPTTGEQRARAILKHAGGFAYYVSVTGVTGVRPIPLEEVRASVRRLRSWTDVPIGVGFGIATPEQAGAVARFADAVVVGSAIMKLVDLHRQDPQLYSVIGDFVRGLKDAMRQVDEEMAVAPG